MDKVYTNFAAFLLKKLKTDHIIEQKKKIKSTSHR